jgi:hypothetical protein
MFEEIFVCAFLPCTSFCLRIVVLYNSLHVKENLWMFSIPSKALIFEHLWKMSIPLTSTSGDQFP